MKQKEALKKISIFIFFVIVLLAFYKINETNYKIEKKIQEIYVYHPENLPKSQVAKLTSFGFNNLRADLYRLKTIQYIWGNAINAEYKKYLFKITDLITDLNPFFEHPYIIAQLLLPDFNYRYEKLSDLEQKAYIDQWINVWLKGMKNFCNEDTVALIKKEFDLVKIWSEEKYKNPCKSYKVPFYLAYIYYFYKNDPINSAFYYKVASANEDSLEWAKIMAAIMQWKWWDREKSIFMFLTLARSVVDEKKEIDRKCLWLINQIEQIRSIDTNVIKGLEKLLVDIFWKFNDKREKEFLDSNSCQNYVNKTVREINLYYLDNANKAYFKSTWKNAFTDKELFEKWYIDYVPKDFQQYKEYGITYEFNVKTGYFDYVMSDY